ncbi:hypothetical protein EJB05_15682, partial [Eragrostis curvula]
MSWLNIQVSFSSRESKFLFVVDVIDEAAHRNEQLRGSGGVAGERGPRHSGQESVAGIEVPGPPRRGGAGVAEASTHCNMLRELLLPEHVLSQEDFEVASDVHEGVRAAVAAFFSGLMQLSMAQDTPAAARARVVDVTAIDQAIAYLLMFAALLVTYFAL